jgi:imidazolonepropionase-like amidohydrolase
MSLRFALLAALSAFLAPVSLSETLAITGAEVHADPGNAPLARATVIVRDGIVVSITPDGPVPEGARVIDATGQVVTPGLFNGFTRTGLSDIGLDTSNDERATSALHAASLDAEEAFNPETSSIAITMVEGVTHIMVIPEAGDTPFGGLGLVAVTSGDPRSVRKSRAALYLEFGERGAALAGGSRTALMAYLEAAIDDAMTPSREGEAVLRLDGGVLRDVVTGQIPLLVHVNRASDIRRLLAFKARHPGVKMILVGAGEAWRVADEIAAAGVPVLLNPFQNLPQRFEMIGARADAAVILKEAGVTFAISMSPNTDEAYQARLLPQLASNAVGYGLDPQTALAAITSVPADIFGVEAGRIKVGRPATLVVWDGPPLEVMSSPTLILVEGVERPLVSRQSELARRYHPESLADGEAGYRR